MKILACIILAGVILAGCSQSDKKPLASVNNTAIPVIDVRTGSQTDDSEAETPKDPSGTIPEEVSDGKEVTSEEESVGESEEGSVEEPEEESAEDPEEGSTEDADTITEPDIASGSDSVALDPSWKFADHAAISSGSARLYRAQANRKNVVIGVNAGHGTRGGQSVKTLCHPDGSAKVTGGTTSAGSVKAVAVSGGMTFVDGTSEAAVALRCAQLFRDTLLAKGYDVLMLRDGEDVQLDNVARTVIANNAADCMISLHWDGDGLSYDKGCFYISVPDGLKGMEPVATYWQQHEKLGQALIGGLSSAGCKINGKGSMAIDLTQTSYSTIPSVDIELGNAASAHDDATLSHLATALADGVARMF